MNTISIQSVLKSIMNITAEPVAAARNHDFDSLFIEAVYNKFSKRVIMDMQYSWELFRKGFNAAQKSNFDIANYYFEKGQETLNKSSFDEAVLKYLNIYITPKLSYYHYKKEDFKSAEELTWKALHETEYIETEFPNMHMGKIQQLHNIARLLMKQNRYTEAHEYERYILDYLMLHKLPDLSGKWDVSNIKDCDQELVSLMTFQVFSEKIVNLIAIQNIDQKPVLEYFASLENFNAQYAGDHQYILFARAIKSYNISDIEGFINYSDDFFASANVKFTAFKHYLVILYLSLIDPNTLDSHAEQLLIESLQAKIRVTPWMLAKYKSIFQSIKEGIC